MMQFEYDYVATPATVLIKSSTKVTDMVGTSILPTIPVVGNVALMSDSGCTAGRAALNFYYSPNPLSKVFFGVNCACGVVGAISSGTCIVTSYMGIPVTGLVGAFESRAFNRLGKYSLHLGNLTSGTLTNATEFAEFIS
ncbi:MAG: hypothetical protein AAFR37_14720 [Cyanobacteria bacterium J06628_3]